MDKSKSNPTPRARILDAASKVFADEGFAGARVDEIARRAGVNKAMLYYHVGDKTVLYHAVLERNFGRVNAILAAVVELDASPTEQLTALITDLAVLVQQHPEHPRIVLREVAAGAPNLPPEILRQMLMIIASVRSILERGVAAGEFRSNRPDPHPLDAGRLAGVHDGHHAAPRADRQPRSRSRSTHHRRPPELSSRHPAARHCQGSMSMQFRSVPTLISTIALVVIATAACHQEDSLHGDVRASGHIEATEVRIASTIGGRLLSAPFHEGDPVDAGEVMATFDTTELRHELARARAELDAADAQLRLLLSGTRAEDLRRAEERLASARAELDAADRDLTRLRGLADRGTATTKTRDDASTRFEIAERAVATAQAELDKLVAGPRREEIAAARAHRAAAAALVAKLTYRMSEATVRAPCDGMVTSRVAEPGEVLFTGAPITVLTDLDHPWLNVWVDEPSLSRIALGDTAEVRVDGQEAPYKGTVTFVSDVAEFTPKNVQTPAERASLVFRVKIALDNADGIFKPGMPADAVFHERRSDASSTDGR